MTTNKKSLFNLVVDSSKLHPNFKRLKEWEGAVSTRLMLDEVFQKFDDPEKNFLEQFQTNGFDARYFELYLFAYLSRSGFQVNREKPNPDFIVSKNGLSVAIEATTVNPSSSGVLSKLGKKISELSPQELKSYQHDELAIRFGGPLFTKLNKKYWELEHCKGMPIVLAIEAFHDQEALTMSDYALTQYIYGLRQTAGWEEDGALEIQTSKVAEHSLGEKTIPSNFFKQPNAENISAIIFTNSGTSSKFSRMGFQQGFGCEVLHISRSGFCFNPNPNAMDSTFFSYNLDEPPFVESWGQGLVVLHNPDCLHPIPFDFFEDAVQGYINDGKFNSDHPHWHPITSKTIIIYMAEVKNKLKEVFPKVPQFSIGAIGKDEFQAACGFIVPPNPIGEEHGWYADDTGSFLGILVRDKIDDDWGFVVLARDEYFQFRAIETECSFSSRDEARIKLQIKIAELLSNPKRLYSQGEYS